MKAERLDAGNERAVILDRVRFGQDPTVTGQLACPVESNERRGAGSGEGGIRACANEQ